MIDVEDADRYYAVRQAIRGRGWRTRWLFWRSLWRCGLVLQATTLHNGIRYRFSYSGYGRLDVIIGLEQYLAKIESSWSTQSNQGVWP